ncbi:MAG: helix-turn-helix transcriptional regulator [Planctomycetota bacterium]|nr:helix-turn-helix transcriptional regulator [Planctomycetota bacterium]
MSASTAGRRETMLMQVTTAPLAARACDVVARALLLDRDTPEDWLEDVCESLCEMAAAPVAASAFVVHRPDDPSERRLGEPAMVRAPLEGSARRFADAVEHGLEQDETLFRRGDLHLWASPVCAPRSAFIDDRSWPQSPLYRFRRSIGIHDFLRAQIPMRGPEGLMSLVFQLDGLLPTWKPKEELIEVFGPVCTHAARAFHQQFLALALMRSQLLELISPSQRAIAPLLAEGMSETAVGQRLERSHHTVHDHRKAIYKAWGVKTRFDLRDLWMGLRPPPAGLSQGGPADDFEAEWFDMKGRERPRQKKG